MTHDTFKSIGVVPIHVKLFLIGGTVYLSKNDRVLHVLLLRKYESLDQIKNNWLIEQETPLNALWERYNVAGTYPRRKVINFVNTLCKVKFHKSKRTFP
jgi:hypothetical protein